ncbi:exodeoxyribonuclease VII large subunit [Clostridium cochlearium]|uniref:Exodeoxyribonuclease 7 large subunit n=1 Tax=Clostridium cochlearium TaxID=1494 RepID=A0A240A8N6_CLOCO|nr:exodeoxyribonuclease VII large subunit [Clostridium cochlearium]MBV1816978.1 exodeoxyribonuclease VII large subunit [Bacteroidales bacterium MSK.15.36]NSJ90766.1 exodeoxyribonuclease VII large subunit [Coprococcus sp. MSK.21.13]MBE6065355.1 exodeoxyribonuclease VII large subunit [Clostridium cochlearium]MBU5268983.1 exodeoxyribonuclease VII large subunit [Clostridium cochlearium]MCG4570730.1 exodeoxyribonuclease VII large subunit [Clostridium cochlearium]
MYIKILSVSDINNYIKNTMDNDFILNNASIKGEISNFKIHSSGHIYFSMKDQWSKINCVMFRSAAKGLKFLPENGMKVIGKGRISTYVKDGAYQLYCDKLELEGLGELYIAFEKLKSKLEKEGLFKEEYKKPLPKYAKKIGVITSQTGAAIRDIINVATRRNKNCEILIYPSLVQGTNASADIIKGIKELNKIKDLDVIILARGGGSIEELWAFNDEELAREVFNSKIPIITGVGHETDFTIVDFVSDKRAPTPSAAAEIAIKDLQELNSNLENYRNTLNYYILNNLKEKYNKLDRLKLSLEGNSPERIIINEYNKIDFIINKLNSHIKTELDKRKEELSKMSILLSSNNPLNILNKGYSVIQDEKGKVISSIKVLDKKKKVTINLKDGKKEYRIQ